MTGPVAVLGLVAVWLFVGGVLAPALGRRLRRQRLAAERQVTRARFLGGRR